ncbi:MAG: sugar ABC transporter substrate-binding protein [Lachnospiraceae bacterium]
MGKEKKSEEKKYKPRQDTLIRLLWAVIAILLAGTILSFVLYRSRMQELVAAGGSTPSYRRHFSFVGDSSKTFQSAVYEAAAEEAAAQRDYLEFTGSSLDVSYSLEELMDLAAASSPDGIIVNALDTEGMENAVNSAAQSGIPVICVGTDIYGSKRSSYVGISYYTLGQTYAQCILPLTSDDKQQTVLVIGSPEEHTTGQNLILSGLRDTLTQSGKEDRFTVTYQTVGDDKSFSTAEAVTDLFMGGDLPDILICLDETSTTCACQAVVDANHVGDVAIFGYYLNDFILDAIQKEVINGSLTVSTKEIGKSAVDNLEEYLSTGFTSEYTAIGIDTVTEENADTYEEETP